MVGYIADHIAESLRPFVVVFSPCIFAPILFYYFFTNKVILRGVKRGEKKLKYFLQFAENPFLLKLHLIINLL